MKASIQIRATAVAIVLVAASCTFAAGKSNAAAVTILPGENWWGLGSNFGLEMPFTEKSDFKCDLVSMSFESLTPLQRFSEGTVL